MAHVLSGLIASGAVLLIAAPALAQTQPPSPGQSAPNRTLFARDRNVSVSQRPHPGYDPVPVQLGGFTALPKLDAGLEYNDNIYAVDTGRKSDTIWTVAPQVDIVSNWSRNALQAFIRSSTRAYSRYSTETSTDYQLGAQGRLDAGDAKFSAGGDTGLLTEPRTSPSTTSGTTRPVRYQQSDLFLQGVQEFNRVRVLGRFDLTDMDYHNGVDPKGKSFLQDDRDRTLYIYSGRAEYAVSPDASVYLDASYNDRKYRLKPPAAASNRSSHGEQINVGASFDLTHTVRGDIKVGWMQQDFANKAFSRFSGMTALGTLEWFPSDLTTVTVSGSRQIQDAAASGAAVFISSSASGQVDHELLRNLILTGRVSYEDDAYRGTSRDDKMTIATVGARYMMNRLVGVTVGYTYQNNDSSGAQKGPQYKDNRINAAVNLKF